jgi:putative ABC transport system ATP-binding protein
MAASVDVRGRCTDEVRFGMAFVEFRDVSKMYQMGEVSVAAVRAMSFQIEQGEFVVIVGPSGAGKTTLLNMLGGMDSATSGTIMLDGAEVSSFNRRQLTQYRRHDIGFVFQFYNLVQNLTARENVELASQICRDPLPADEVLAAVGLADRARNFPGQLSGGEQQRVAIARALAKNPKLLLCDEPTGALDFETGKAILRLLQDTCRTTGRTVVVVTHNSAFTAIADRVIHVREGSVAAVERNEAPLSAEVLEW